MTHEPQESEKPADGRSEQDLGELYREHVDYVWRSLMHLGVASADVPDMAQEVFLTVKRRLPSFEGRSSVRTWIYGICIRMVSDYRNRAFRRREVLHDEIPDVAGAPGQHATAEQNRLRKVLGELLDELNSEQREVFVLYEIEELGMKEVAEALNCPLQTAYSRLHAARAQLKKRLSDGGFKP
jgi:RNA polymerase sigma-70 factor (ECF subfamily)